MSGTSNIPPQQSVQQKLVRKLEKENAGLKKNRNILQAVNSEKIKIATNKALGEHVLMCFGQDGTESAHTLVFHRTIGKDFAIPREGAWVVSNAQDIPGFTSTAIHPGLQKINKNISESKDAVILALKLLNQQEDGTWSYPGIAGSRTTHLDDASWYREHYSKAMDIPIKNAPLSDYFSLSDVRAAEYKFSTGLYTSPQFAKEVKPLYAKQAFHQPHTISMKTQMEAKYLYGKEISELPGLFYSKLTGTGIDPGSAAKRPEDYNVIEVTVPAEPMAQVDDAELRILHEHLDRYGSVLKEKNIADNALKALPRNASKDDKKVLVERIKALDTELISAKSHVKAASFKWPTYAYKSKKISILKRSEMAT
jgi:hypothetical protein